MMIVYGLLISAMICFFQSIETGDKVAQIASIINFFLGFYIANNIDEE